MKVAIVFYIGLSLGAFVWQIATGDFIRQCEYNAGACTVAMKSYGLHALMWPKHLLLWQKI